MTHISLRGSTEGDPPLYGFSERHLRHLDTFHVYEAFSAQTSLQINVKPRRDTPITSISELISVTYYVYNAFLSFSRQPRIYRLPHTNLVREARLWASGGPVGPHFLIL